MVVGASRMSAENKIEPNGWVAEKQRDPRRIAAIDTELGLILP
jgi:hypothetical protein